ncbi:hypothetical protein BC828DRAFT_373866 [Blastocladiella britannica]|nr:hypothetical protein BC828DRAFT_373866 [Blastocladiella britannica]
MAWVCLQYAPGEQWLDVFALILALLVLPLCLRWVHYILEQSKPAFDAPATITRRTPLEPGKQRSEATRHLLHILFGLGGRGRSSTTTTVFRTLLYAWLCFTIDQLALVVQIIIYLVPSWCPRPCRNYVNMPDENCPGARDAIITLMVAQNLGAALFACATILRFRSAFALLSRWRYVLVQIFLVLLAISCVHGLASTLLIELLDRGFFPDLPNANEIHAIISTSMRFTFAVAGAADLACLVVGSMMLFKVQAELAAIPSSPDLGDPKSNLVSIWNWLRFRPGTRQGSLDVSIVSTASSSRAPILHEVTPPASPTPLLHGSPSVFSAALTAVPDPDRRRQRLVHRLRSHLRDMGLALGIAWVTILTYFVLILVSTPLWKLPINMQNSLLTAMLKIYSMSSSVIILCVKKITALSEQVRNDELGLQT